MCWCHSGCSEVLSDVVAPPMTAFVDVTQSDWVVGRSQDKVGSVIIDLDIRAVGWCGSAVLLGVIIGQ